MALNTRTKNLILGVSLLLLVDVIWVLSNELTKFLYQNESYDKPLFCTYFKSSMFSLYLLAFAFLAPFQDAAPTSDSTALVCDNRRSYAALLEDNNETTPFGGGPPGHPHNCAGGNAGGTLTDDEDSDDDQHQAGTTLRNRPTTKENNSRLSESIFVPIKDESGSLADEFNHTCNHSQSVAESSDEEEESSVRSVRFNRMAEVREMSPLDAPDALLARLSYSASLRIRRQKSHHKTARTALLFAILVSCSRFRFVIVVLLY